MGRGPCVCEVGVGVGRRRAGGSGWRGIGIGRGRAGSFLLWLVVAGIVKVEVVEAVVEIEPIGTLRASEWGEEWNVEK